MSDGEEISAVEHKADSDRWLFVCHGLASNKKRGGYESLCERAAENGFNAVRFDFRGNGESEGNFSQQTVESKIEDLKTVVRHFSPEHCVLFGSSFGAKVAFQAMEELNPEALVLQKPVLLKRNSERYERLAEEDDWERYGGKSWGKEFVETYRAQDFEKIAEEIDIPVLIFHGSEDDIIDFGDTLDAVRDLETDITLRNLQGEKHSLSDEARGKVKDESFRWMKDEL